MPGYARLFVDRGPLALTSGGRDFHYCLWSTGPRVEVV